VRAAKNTFVRFAKECLSRSLPETCDGINEHRLEGTSHDPSGRDRKSGFGAALSRINPVTNYLVRGTTSYDSWLRKHALAIWTNARFRGEILGNALNPAFDKTSLPILSVFIQLSSASGTKDIHRALWLLLPGQGKHAEMLVCLPYPS
jgi:hypothetical protein